jgi:hypothetical protein
MSSRNERTPNAVHLVFGPWSHARRSDLCGVIAMMFANTSLAVIMVGRMGRPRGMAPDTREPPDTLC